jgi:hypothetical protein
VQIGGRPLYKNVTVTVLVLCMQECAYDMGRVDGGTKLHSRYAEPDLYYYSNIVFKLKQSLA